MLISFSINLNSEPLCPCCLTVLSSRNVMFYGRFAFCPNCLHGSEVANPEEAVWAIVNYLHTRHLSEHRNLIFFTPQRKPKTSVQLIPFDSETYWREDAQPRGLVAVEKLSQEKAHQLGIESLEH